MDGEGPLGFSSSRNVFPLLVSLCVACRAAPPPQPPPAPAPPPAVVVAPPPPPPKCEKLEEACVSRAATRARIGRAGWDFVPPEGWTYAQGDDVTTATIQSATFGVAAQEGTNAKNERAQREAVLRRVADRLGVTLPRKRELINRRPDKKEKVGEIDVELYQIDGCAREGKKGPLLVFAAKVGDGAMLLGMGFVADDDKDNSDGSIMKAIGSLAARKGDASPAKASP